MFFLYKMFFLLIFIGGKGIYSQEVFSNLKNPKDIQVFTTVSESLVCQCGCRFLLSVCPHIECPWGIPARRIIEKEILLGKSAEKIVYSFKNGFGNEIYKNTEAKLLLEQGKKQFVEELMRGYGRKIQGKTSFFLPVLLIIIFFLIAVFLIVYWYNKNKKI